MPKQQLGYNLRSRLIKPNWRFPNLRQISSKGASRIELRNRGTNFQVKPSKITMNYQSYRLNGDYIIRYKIDANNTDTLYIVFIYLSIYILYFIV
jgi:hypothetical protein